MARATALVQYFAKVTYGTTKILGAGKFSISGMNRKTIESSEYGDDIDVFEFGTADGGTISVTDVVYDPTDTTGQNMINALINSSLKSLGGNLTSGLRFYINSTSYWQVGTSGWILITNAQKVDSDRNGLAKWGFEGKVSGASMTMYLA